MAAAARTSKTPTGTCWRFLPGLTAAVRTPPTARRDRQRSTRSRVRRTPGHPYPRVWSRGCQPSTLGQYAGHRHPGRMVSCGDSGLIAAGIRRTGRGRGVRAILKGWRRALVMSAAAASVVGLAAAPAFAATTWTVKPGGAVTGTAGKTVVTDATAGASITCT